MAHENGNKQKPAMRRHVQGMLDETDPSNESSLIFHLAWHSLNSGDHFSDNGSIEVSDADGSNRLVLVHGKIDEPRAVAVHPKKRSVFICILKSAMNLF